MTIKTIDDKTNFTSRYEKNPRYGYVASFDGNQALENRDQIQQQSAEIDIVLPKPLQLLYALNGATLSLPSLALTSIINTRIAVPPTYLSAYYAIAFLPYSLKPCYALLTTYFHSSSCHFLQQRKNERQPILLPVLYALLAITMAATALIKQGAVGACFALAFVRGVFDSWAEFLVGLSLLQTAKQQHRDFAEVAAVFQSQAATCRNVGSFAANGATLSVFFYRYFYSDETNDGKQLSQGLVTGLLLVTALLPLFASGIAWIHTGKAMSLVPPETNQGNEVVIPASGAPLDYKRNNRNESQKLYGCYENANTSQEPCSEENREVLASGEKTMEMPNLARIAKHARPKSHKFDAISLILFQITLIVCALRGPFVTVASKATWNSLVIVLASCLTISVSFSSCYADSSSWMHLPAASSFPTPKKVALYLMLRHSAPSSSFVLSSYVYTVFQSSPLYLQFLSIVESVATIFSTWSYSKYLAKRFSTRNGIITVIAGTTFLGSLCRLLYVPLVHFTFAAAAGHADNKSSNQTLTIRRPQWYVFVASVQLLTTFVDEWAFMPSIVLATASLVSPCTKLQVSSDDEDVCNLLDCGKDEENMPNETLVTVAEMKEVQRNTFKDENSCTAKTTTVSSSLRSKQYIFDEGMQYASLVSCIDFGDQIGDWITVPIVSALDVRRENNWAHLDKLIAVCSAASVASLLFLVFLRKDRRLSPIQTR